MMKPPPKPKLLTAAGAPSSPVGTAGSAPPVYRPQASTVSTSGPPSTRVIPSATPVQLKPAIASAVIIKSAPKPYTVVQPKAALGQGQPRLYPNLNPAAAIKIDPAEFMRLEGSFDDSYYRMRRGGDHGLLVPNTKYIFVRTLDGEMVMHQRYRHPVLAQGKPVLYAGEAYFNNGKLDWWSNGSGNYRPDADHAEQAHLPMEKFFTYEQVLKGANKQ
ncbi:MAG TPA: hypothetical protein VFB79_19330 [Candidatus Angelobacter sp.]|nr:hypothetical protein [Candidatus Angelobacter sp.]